MACRDCRYFDAEDDDMGFCRFPERAFPDWLVSSLHAEHVETHYWKHASDGTDCPAFKERPMPDWNKYTIEGGSH